MPFNETAVYMEKLNKHETSTSTTTTVTRDAKLLPPPPPPPSSGPSRHNESLLAKFQGCKWEQVFDIEKMLKQIRNTEKYYLRGKYDQVAPAGSAASSKSGNSMFASRQRPQVQRLKASDMHFYGMVPKQPFDVVVCDICLGIYTKMGFNNHMRLHHPQAWSAVSAKPASSKDTGHHASTSTGGGSGTDKNQSSARDSILMGPPMDPISTSSSVISRHKSSSKSSGGSSSGGSSRSRSKSKHHHHHHQQQSQSQPIQQQSSSSTNTTQTSTSNSEMSPQHHVAGNNKSTKKSSTALMLSGVDSKLAISKETSQTENLQPITISTSSGSSSVSSSSSSLPPTSKVVNSDSAIASQDVGNQLPTNHVPKEKSTKSSKKKSKNSSASASIPTAYIAQETPESSSSNSNSSIESAGASSVVTSPVKPTTKRASRPKGGKDLKQMMEPQLSELDQAVSSIIGGQTNTEDIGLTNCANSMSYKSEDAQMPLQQQQQVPMTAGARQQQQLQQAYNAPQMLATDDINNAHSQQNSNGEDNDNSMLTLDDIDSKFINEILNTDEAEIHFDESELDTATQQQAPQSYMQQQQQQQPGSKRMRYDGNCEQQQPPALNGKFAAYQQQEAFQVSNLDDVKMYATALDAQQYMATQQPQQHQITTIDAMQLQQLLYQQQQQQQQHQQGLNTYAVGPGMEDMSATALVEQQQQQQHYSDTDVIMCSAEQLHKEGKINAADYATLTALNNSNNGDYSNTVNGMCDVMTASAAAAAAQFQIYNIPSLTDDDDDMGVGRDSKLCNLPPQQQHYVLPSDASEDQLIYEITANNQVAVISQQRQQQMIAEFLTQAGYDNVDSMNVNMGDGVAGTNGIIGGGGGNSNSGDGSNCNSSLDDDINSELLDFDYSLIETVSSCGSNTSETKGAVKSEHGTKHASSSTSTSSSNAADDLFLNVFVYAGMPRPLAVNCFGLIKLPQAVATTFRKNLHATRKANNSPMSLSGAAGGSGMNGVLVGTTATSGATNATASAARFATNASTSKASGGQSYFTALGGAAGGNSLLNEFSIGSITITNQSPTNVGMSPQQQQPVQQQQLASHKQLSTTPVEITFNAPNGNGLAATSAALSPPVQPQQQGFGRSRPKSAVSASTSGSSGSQLRHKTSSSSSSSSGSSANTLPLAQHQAKTILVNATHATTGMNADHTKFIKRSLISKTFPVRNHTNFTPKQLSDLLLHPSKDGKEKYLQLLATHDRDQSAAPALGQQRLSHVNRFYERRKRLLHATTTAAAASVTTTSNYGRHQHASVPQPGATTAASLKQKLLRQRLLRTLSDCGINSMKNNNSSANAGNNGDIMRVFA